MCISNLYHVTDNHYSIYSSVSEYENLRYFYNNSSILYCDLQLEQNFELDTWHFKGIIMDYIHTNNSIHFKEELMQTLHLIKDSNSLIHFKRFLGELFLLYQNKLNLTCDFHNKLLFILSDNYTIAGLVDDIILTFNEISIHSDFSYSEINICKKIFEFMCNNYQDATFQVNTIAKEFNLSISYIGSIYKKVNKKTIIQHLTEIRLEKALLLLKKDNRKISDIALEVGYTDVFYFSRRFKQIYGYSPIKYKDI